MFRRRCAGAADGFRLVVREQLFLVITPQGGSQNVIFVASNYLRQPEFSRLGFFVTLFFLAIFLVIGTG
jgi:di/tricarboxylate transporter